MRVGVTPQAGFQYHRHGTGLAVVGKNRPLVVAWLIPTGKTTHATVRKACKTGSPPAMAGDRGNVEVPPR